jgi:hypothetical protein
VTCVITCVVILHQVYSDFRANGTYLRAKLPGGRRIVVDVFNMISIAPLNKRPQRATAT